MYGGKYVILQEKGTLTTSMCIVNVLYFCRQMAQLTTYPNLT